MFICMIMDFSIFHNDNALGSSTQGYIMDTEAMFET